MDKSGYVYVARIIDHGGEFVNGYHKIGLSKKYKIRETQLNATHLPFDVLMIRVMQTEDMHKLETMLHICFDDYRVIKEYEDRRNITTEWFNVKDIDTFNDRIDKMINLLDVTEVDLTLSIDKDETLSHEEKIKAKENIGKAKSTKLKVSIGDKIFINETSKETYIDVLNHITKNVDKDLILDKFSTFFKKDKTEFTQSMNEYNKVQMNNNLFMSTWGSNKLKAVRIKSICEELNIQNVKCELI